MPRIRTINPDAFNSVQDPSSMRVIDVSVAHSAMAEAVENDHPNCDSNTCDISQALEAGYPFVAAGMLSGATECAHVDAVCCALGFNGTLPAGQDPRRNMYAQPEWQEWADYFDAHTIECECGAYVFGESGDWCDNCAHELP